MERLEDRLMLTATPAAYELLVNDLVVRHQGTWDTASSIAISDANLVVTFAGKGPADPQGVFAKLYDDQGTQLLSTFQVNTTRNEAQHSPVVATDLSGNFVVAWAGRGAGDQSGVFFQRFNAHGQPLGGESLVNSTTGGVQEHPAIAMSASGGFVIAWQGVGSGDSAGVFQRRFNAQGAALGAETLVNQTTHNQQAFPSVAIAADGNSIITWSSRHQDGSDWAVLARKFSATGALLTDEFFVNATTTQSQSQSRVVFEPSGNFWVSWSSYGQDGDSWGTYARQFSSSGSPLGGEQRINSATSGHQKDISLAISRSGDIFATYASGVPDGSGWELYTQPLTSTGNLDGDALRVNERIGGYASGDQQFAAAAFSTADDLAVVYSGNGASDRGGVYLTSLASVASVTLTPIDDQSIDELTTLAVQASATTSNGAPVTYSLERFPEGATIDSATGAIRWTPTEAQGPGVFAFTVVATLSTTRQAKEVFIVTVREVNQSPVLAAIGNRSIAEEQLLTFTASATDADLPAQRLIYRLGDNAPAGATIDPLSGVFRWTPTEVQGPGDYPVTVIVTDLGSPEGTDQETITITVGEVNRPPVLSEISELAIPVGGTLVVALTATDPDLPTNTLTFRADQLPIGATLDVATGIVRWIPTEAQADQTFAFTISVLDNGTPGLSDTVTFQVTVTGTNEAPLLAPIEDETVGEGTLFTVTASATDPDNDPLIYSLEDFPAGAVINPQTGVITWTPTEAQGPGDYVFTIIVSDDGNPALSDTTVFMVTVLEVNLPPAIVPIDDKTIDEEKPFNLTVVASDPDLPANLLTFSLLEAPLGAIIHPTTGVISWTPTEEQGPGNYDFRVQVSDNGQPPLTTTAEFTVTVREVNRPPLLSEVGPQTIQQGEELVVVVTATDPDLPANTLTFRSDSLPVGATLDEDTGVVRWIPTEAQADQAFAITISVLDNGTPQLSDTVTFQVTVIGTNEAPVFAPIEDETVNEGTLFTVTATATDADNDPLTYALENFPVGAVINPQTGVITWTPTAAQGPGEYVFTVVVSDDGNPGLTDTTVFVVTVLEVNLPPVIVPIDDQTIDEETPFQLTVVASDPDLPANLLTFSLLAAPAGAIIHPTTGVVSWTPTEEQGPGEYPFRVQVSDNGQPPLTATAEFNVTVGEVNRPPLLSEVGRQTIQQGEELVVVFTATDADIPLNTLAFEIVGDARGATLVAGQASRTAEFRWTSTEEFEPGSYPFTIRVSDNGAPAAFHETTLTVEVLDGTESFSGWILTQDGGTPGDRGGVTLSDTAAQLVEGDSFRVALERVFIVPAGATTLSFEYADLNFDTTDTGFINDAFEVALIDADGFSLVPTYTGTADRDAFFNVSEDVGLQHGSGVTITDNIVTLSLAGVAFGTHARLIFRLANNDTDNDSSVRISSVVFPEGSTPPPESSTSKFFVVDAGLDSVFRYSESGTDEGAFIAPTTATANPRGIASSATGDRLWTIDGSSQRVYVYGPSGADHGQWLATGLTAPEGITVWGEDLWIVDAGFHRVYFFDGAVARQTGTAGPSSSFTLDLGNTSPSDLVTDGTMIWVTDDAADRVFVYSTAGTLLGSWSLDAANSDASGITLDPTGAVSDLWTVDRADGLVYRYANARGRVDGSQDAADSFALVAGNVAPEGIADPAEEFARIKFHKDQFDVRPESYQVIATPVVIDINGDQIGDIIFSTYDAADFVNYRQNGLLRAISGSDGSELWTVIDPLYELRAEGGLAVGDIDNDGLPEIIAVHESHALIAFEHDGSFKWISSVVTGAGGPFGPVGFGAPSLADLDADGVPEIIIGASVINADGSIRWEGMLNGGLGTGQAYGSPLSLVADLDLDGVPEVVGGKSAYRSNGQVYWNADIPDGLSAIANLDADAYPEIVVVSNGKLYILEHDGSLLQSPIDIPGGGLGGAPVIADVDGDGMPEIGVAGNSRYVVFEHDGAVKWQAPTKDGSSQTTGSTVFDLDSDGRAEIIYGDEAYLRIYNGATGSVLYEVPKSSGTLFEMPIVVDLERDGHAEIIAVANSDATLGAEHGIFVIEGAKGDWAATRQIWNQHSYHITNVNDDGTIPAVELNSWELYNNYRRNQQVTGTAIFPPTISASAPVSTALPGTQIVITGEAIANLGTRTSDQFVIGGFDAARAAGLSISDGAPMEELRTAILASFPGATFRSTAELTSEYLADVDVLVITTFGGSNAGIVLTAQEQEALSDYFASGGDALLFTDNNFTESNANANHSLLQLLGMNSTGAQSSANVSTVVGDSQSHPVTNGPFGVVSTYSTHFTGWFDVLGPYAQSLATLSTNGQPALAVIPENAMNSGSGRIVVFNDISMLVEGAPFHGPMSAENRRLVLNALAYAADAVPGTEASGRNRIVSVEVNGTAVDVLDANGKFFAAVEVRSGENRYRFTAYDAVGQTVSTEVVVTGTQATAAVDFSRYADITGSLQGVYGRTSFRDGADILYVDLATRNDGTFATDVPLLVGIKNITDPSVRVLGADGVTPDGIPYFDLSSFVTNRRLAPGETSGSPTIAFYNPDRHRFGYELVFYGQLNQAPRITSVPDVEALIGKPYRYLVTASDEDGDVLTYRLLESPDATMQIDHAMGVITWTPTADQEGNHTVVVQVDDGRGGKAEQRYTLTVVPAPPNRPPVITSVPVTMAEVSSRIGGRIVVANDEWTLSDAGFQATADTRTFVLNVANYFAPDGGGKFLAYSNNYGLTGTTLAQTIREASHELTVSTSVSFTLETLQQYDAVFVGGFPADNDVLTQYVRSGGNVYLLAGSGSVGEPNNATLEAEAWVSFLSEFGLALEPIYRASSGVIPIDETPHPIFAGVEQLYQQVGQPISDLDSADALGTIVARLAEDGLYAVFDERVAVGQAYRYQVTAIDADDDPLTYGISVHPDGMSINPATGEVRWAPTADQVGDHRVVVEVTDGRGGMAKQEFIVCVEPDPNNHAPIIVSDPITTLSLAIGPELIVNGSFESGPELSSELPLDPGSTALSGWSVIQDQVHYVGARWGASDGGRSLDLDGLDFHAGGIAQTIHTIPGASYLLSFDLAGNPANGPQFKQLRVAAAGQSIDLSFDITGASLEDMKWRQVTWTFVATEELTTVSFTSLNSVANAGWGPVIDNVSVKQSLSGQYHYDLDAIDADDDTLIYALVDAPPGMTIDANTGLITWNAGLLGQNLVTNGDFEQGDTEFASSLRSDIQPSNPGTYRIGTDPFQVYGSFNPNVGSFGDRTTGTGNMMVVNGSEDPSAINWEQNVPVTPGKTYEFFAWASTTYDVAPAQLRFKINGETVGTPLILPASEGIWQRFYVRWTSETATMATIQITNDQDAGVGNDFALDDIGFAEVFEGASVPVTVRVTDGRGGVDEQTFTIEVKQPGTGEIRGTKWQDVNGNGVRDAVVPERPTIDPSEDTILLLTWNGLGNTVAPALTAMGFEVLLGTLAPGQIESALNARTDINQVWVWTDQSAGNSSFAPADPSRSFSPADLLALRQFSASHSQFVMDGLAFRDHDNSAEIGLSQNIAANLQSWGGGIVLGTDDGGPGSLIKQHVNQVSAAFDFSPWVGIYNSSSSNLHEGGNLLSEPNGISLVAVASTGSYSEVPHGQQPNGLFLSTSIFASPASPFSSDPPLSSDEFGGVTYASVNHLVTTTIPGGGIDAVPEPGIGGWTIYLDENDNGRRDVGERWTTTVDGSPTVVYANDFEDSARLLTEWSNPRAEISPTGRRFLGQFGNSSTTLTLADLPAHDTLQVTFDLYVINSWDGNGIAGNYPGPDFWSLAIVGGDTLLHTTFGAGDPVQQSFPENYPAAYPALTHSVAQRILGIPYDGGGSNDSVYRLTFDIPHSSSSIGLVLSASGLQALGDESWGIDNVVVSIPSDRPAGSYAFTGLPAGTYIVREEPQPGWQQTYPGSSEEFLYGINSDGLVQINPATGAGSYVFTNDFGNFQDVETIESGAAGELIAVINARDLIRIDPVTKQVETLGTVLGVNRIEALAYHDGQWFAAASVDGDDNAETLVRLDIASLGSETIGPFGAEFDDVDGLAISPDGLIVGTNIRRGAHFLFSVDPTTGDGTLIADLGRRILGLDFADSGILLGAEVAISSSDEPTDLVRIDTTDGAITKIGPIGLNMVSGLAFLRWEVAGGHIVNLAPTQVQIGIDFGNAQLAAGPNENPQFSSTAPTSATFGSLFRYDAIATDADSDPLTYSLVTGPVGMTLNPQTGTVVWQPQEAQLGEHTIILRVTDGRGGVAIQQFTLSVVAPNTPPLFTSIPATQAVQNRPFVYDIAVQDADREPVTVTLEPGSLGTLVPTEVRGPNNELLQTRYRLEWTPSAADLTAGTRTFSLRATDVRGASVLQTVTINVVATAPNAAPQITSTPRVIARPGVQYGYAVIATDANADPLTYSLDPAQHPAGMTISPTGIVTWTPPAGLTGAHPVRVLVSDGITTTDQEFTITIASQADNRGPEIVSNPPQSGRHDKEYVYDAVAQDPDGDPVTWSLDAAPIGMSIHQETGTIRWSPREDQLGTHQVVLRAVDPLGASTVQSFTIEVNCANAPPLILSTPPTQAVVGETYFYGVRAIDPDGDPLTLSLAGGPQGMTISPTGLVRWTPSATDLDQTRTVVVRADDPDGGFVLQEFQIVVGGVTNLNRAPTITSTPVFAVTLGDNYRYQIDATDANGDTLTYSPLVKPDWMTIDPVTGLITGTPTAAGEEIIVVQVSDGTAKTTQGFAVNVRVNQAPTIASNPLTTAMVGGIYRYTVKATDPDGDPLTYSLLPGGPSGMSIDGFGRIVWNVPVDFNGSLPAGQSRLADVKIRVSDSRGATAPQDFTITVAPDTQSPQIVLQTLVGNRTFTGNAEIDLGATATIVVTAYDNVGVTSLVLEIDGQLVPLDAQGRATITAATLFDKQLVAKARDAAGNEGTATGTVRVATLGDRNRPNVNDTTLPPHPGFPTGDTQEPIVTITSPAFNASVTNLTPIIGTIDDPEDHLWYWRVYTARFDQVDLANIDINDPDYRVIAQGTDEVHAAEIAKFDPSAFSNDPYAILVAAFDANGRGYVAATVVTIEGSVKLGAFRLEFSDLSIPLAGIPIEVTRVYDTHDASRQGDFGYGWTLGVKDARILEVGAIGDGGAFDPGANTFVPGKTKVYITNPSGQRVGFTYQERLVSGSFFGAELEAYFVPNPGVYDKLTIDNPQLFRGGILGAFGEGIDPDVYTLTTAAGTAYRYNQSTGLETITDLSGNMVTFTASGIKHSSGVEVKFVRDNRGRITEIIDPAGNKLLYSYNAAGDLVSFKSQEQLTTTFKYHSAQAHYLDEIVDPLGRRAVKTEYDEQGRVLRTIDAAGNVVEYDHSLDGFERVRDAAGNWTALKYDNYGNVTEERRGEHVVTLPGGGQQTVYDSIVRTQYTHERDGTASPNRDKEWRVTQVFLDNLGNILKETTTEYDYDARGNVVKVSDVVGGKALTREFSYDAKNNVTRVKDELDRQTFFTYDAQGNLREVVNAEGNKALTSFDSLGRVTSYTDFNGSVTTFVYAGSQSQPSEIRNPGHTDAAPNVRKFEYNDFGQTTKIKDEEGTITEYGYDSQGRQTYERVGTDAPVRSVYQGQNLYRRIVARSEVELGATDVVTEYGYYDNDLMRFEIDPLGAVTGYEYDANGNRTFLGRWDTKADYDADMMAKAASPATVFAGRYPRATFEHVFVYDRLNRLDYEIDDVQLALAEQGGTPLDEITVRLDYDYDSAGNRTELIDRDGRKRTFEYDERNRMIAELWWQIDVGTSQEEVIRSFTWQYCTCGNVSQATEYDGPVGTSPILSQYKYTYDTLGRLKSTDSAGTKDMPHVILTYGYDTNGNQTRVEDSLGVAVVSTYDAQNRLKTRAWENAPGIAPANAVDEVLVEFDYYRNGTQKELRRYDLDDTTGAKTLVGRTVYGDLDASGRVQTLSHRDAVDQAIAEYTYGFDKLGLVKNLLYDNRDDQYDFEVAYGYDDLGQLVAADYSDATTARGIYSDEYYNYDKNGNRTSSHLHGSGYVTGPGNRLLSDGTFNYEYDNDGNTIRKTEIATGEVTIFEYDYRNLMTRATRYSQPPESGGIILAESTNRYDVEGRRIAFSVDDDGAGANPAEEIRVVHNGNNVWADLHPSDETLVRRLFSNRTDQSLARFSQYSGIAFFLTDHQGTIRDVHDISGQLVNRFNLDSYGVMLSQGTFSVDDRFVFQAREFDSEMEIYSFRSRNYSPSLGRFTSYDSIGFNSRDANLYRFVLNSPLQFVDPSGTMAVSLILRAALVAAAPLPLLAAALSAGLLATPAAMVGSSPKYDGGTDGEGDAMRHCAWAAMTASVVGETLALAVINAKEIGDATQYGLAAGLMDLNNNRVGARIGASMVSPNVQKVTEACEGGLLSGSLIVINPKKKFRF